MSDAWDDRKRAQEEQYFEKANKEAVERLKKRATTARPSPITGQPMEQVTMMGVTVDRCPTSGGIWLDAGELEALIQASQENKSEGALANFFSGLFKSGK